ncbi:MAG: hypothetical protein J6B80_05505 [Clostridia bacterium]|nr:hypothetical protein [Clostridia bacterium]
MKFWDSFVKLLITQGAVALIIILSVLVLKFGFKNTYNQFVNWYKVNILTDTNVYEVIE